MQAAHPVAQPVPLLRGQPRPRDLEVAVVLRAAEPALVEQRDLGVEVAEPVVGHEGRLLHRDDVVGQPLVGPHPVPVGGDGEVHHPGGGGVAAHPDLALDVHQVRPPVGEGAQGAVADVPELPPLPHVCPQGRDVAGEDRDVDVLVLARHPGERLDRPAADDPPRPVEAGEQLRDPGRVEGLPGAVEPVPVLVLGPLIRALRHRLAHGGNLPSAGHSSTRSSRCTTSRSYAAPSSRLSSWEDLPSRLGTSSTSKLTRPRATATPSGPQRSTGSPATNCPVAPVTPAASSEARRSTTARTAPGSSTSVPLGSVACASHSSRVGRRRPVAWKSVPTRSPASAAPACSAAASTTGIPAPVAIRAASTLVCMPPVPTPAAPALPIRTRSRSASVATSPISVLPGSDGAA